MSNLEALADESGGIRPGTCYKEVQEIKGHGSKHLKCKRGTTGTNWEPCSDGKWIEGITNSSGSNCYTNN